MPPQGAADAKTVDNSASVFRSFRYRNARIFFIGLMLSNVGTWLQLTATSLLLYRLTGKATNLGINVMFQFLPMLLLGAWAGGFADRHNRRVVTMFTQSGLAAQALMLGILALSGRATIGWVYTASLVLGIMNAMDNPSRRGLVTELVPQHEISNAISINTAVMTGSRIFGPALATMLAGVVDLGWLFVFNAVSFLAILGSLFLIRPSETFPSPAADKGGRPVRDALAFVRNDRQLLVTFGVFAVVSTFGFNYTVVLPKLCDLRWGHPNAFGWLLAVISVGSLIGSLSTARLTRVSVDWFYVSVVVTGASSLALAWSPNITVACVVAVPLGIGGSALVASMNALSQQKSPGEMRSRLLALVAVAFLGSTPIGGPITGWVADHVSSEWALGYGGIITLMCLASWRSATMER